MISDWEIIYQYQPETPEDVLAVIKPIEPTQSSWKRMFGVCLLTLSLGGIIGPLIPVLRLETGFWAHQASAAIAAPPPLPISAPVVFNPLIAPNGSQIVPVNTDFSVIIPKIGVNAPVIENVDPTKSNEYNTALLSGVAHASTSFTPDQNGTTYLFSHSTNYDWFVKDLNAVFYLLKNLKTGDVIVLYYKGKQYSYTITESKIVNPADISSLVPVVGKNNLILETCWPPGSTTERLLVFADLTK